jgi:hypothetical protein
VVIPVYKRPFRSITFIHHVYNAPPHIGFSPTSGLENKKPSAKEGFLFFWLPFVDEVGKLFSTPGECLPLLAAARELSLNEHNILNS